MDFSVSEEKNNGMINLYFYLRDEREGRQSFQLKRSKEVVVIRDAF